MLSPASIARIEASTQWREHRIESLDLPEGPVVVKGQRPARGPWRFRVLSMLATVTANPLLKPVPAPGGRRSQDTEARRLTTLAESGLPVPRLLHVGPDYLVLQRLAGPSLQQRMAASGPDALSAFSSGLDALSAVHASGQYLSQAFARNLLWSDGRVWFIDFEDDPLQVMPLEDAQARDWLAYLLSAVWLAKDQRPDLFQRWQAVGRRVRPAVLHRVRHASRGLAWLRHLPRKRKPWGRDVVTVQALAEFMHAWEHSHDSFS